MKKVELKEKKYYQVLYGYNAQDRVSIEEGDALERAIYAQNRKVPVLIGGAYINGSSIRVIRPHWHKYTGWYDWYEPKDGEDFAQIGRDCPKLLDETLEYYRDRVALLERTGRQALIGKSADLPEIKEPTEEKRIENRGDGIKTIGGVLKRLKPPQGQEM